MGEIITNLNERTLNFDELGNPTSGSFGNDSITLSHGLPTGVDPGFQERGSNLQRG